MLERRRDKPFGLLVSCVGRKAGDGGRVDEEVEAVQDILGDHTAIVRVSI